MASVKITDLRLYPFRIPLKKPIFVKGQFIFFRDVFILSLTDEEKKTLLAEVSTFPNLHP